MTDFNFASDYILEDEVVLLRPLVSPDYDFLLEYAINEADIWKYSLIQVDGPEGLKNYIDMALTAKENLIDYPFIVYDKRTQKYAGSTRYYDIQLKNQTVQLGYTWYGKNFQGTGLNKHCKYLMLNFAFDFMDMIRVEFRADNNNKRSIAAMKSIGCKVDGVLRSNLPTPQGNRRDSIVLSILKEEWINNVKDDLYLKL